MKLGFVMTNFNNSSYTRNAVESILMMDGGADTHVVVVDNASVPEDTYCLRQVEADYPGVTVIYNVKNVGYFKGLNVGIAHLTKSIKGISHIVVGNNDLIFPPDFMNRLQENPVILKKYAVISPDLITLDGVHQNPHVISDVSWFRNLVWDLYYSNYTLARLIIAAARLTQRYTERKDYEVFHEAQTIAQGYGACYILGPLFFEHFESLWAPSFLMGEEYFLSMQLEKKNLSVFYEPAFKVFHHDHASIGVLPSRKLWNYAREAHKLIRRYEATS